MIATPRPGAGRVLAAAAALVVAMGAGAAAGIGTPRSVTYPAHTMGTYVHVVLVTADSAAASPDAVAALRVFSHTDSLMSNWTTTSEVARINREAAAATVVVEPEVAGVIGRSLEVWRQSDGTFDITVEPLVRVWGFLGGKPHVPTDAEAAAAFRHVGGRHLHFDPDARTLRFDEDGVQIDLGGIAKGYAVDVAAESLRARGVRDALVDLTGNMLAMGHPADAAGWRIGLRDPRDRMPYFARLQLHDEGISTSGKYEQYVAVGGRTFGHIMDPRTGQPAEGLIAVTLVSKSALTCDAWDTPLFVLGLEAARRTALAHPEFEAILVQPGAAGVDTVWVESTLRDRLVLEPAAGRYFRVAYF
jgi:thiamine biosynthesis lipoprotein